MVTNPHREQASRSEPGPTTAGAFATGDQDVSGPGAGAAVVVGATWLVNQPGEVVYLQALLWALGFVFVGLAVEAESAEMALLNLATGIALPVLAWLSAGVAIELAVVAATLVAAWVAAAILRR